MTIDTHVLALFAFAYFFAFCFLRRFALVSPDTGAACDDHGNLRAWTARCLLCYRVIQRRAQHKQIDQNPRWRAATITRQHIPSSNVQRSRDFGRGRRAGRSVGIRWVARKL